MAFMGRSVAALAIGLLCVTQATAAGKHYEDIVGRASVVDGDTLDIRGTRIRLNGVDAVEKRQVCTTPSHHSWRCGKDAAFALDGWLAKSRPVTCKPIGGDRYGRMVADCYRADGSFVNAWLVRQGWAVDWEKYSHGKFASEQREAKAAKRGIWGGTFELPCMVRSMQGQNHC